MSGPGFLHVLVASFHTRAQLRYRKVFQAAIQILILRVFSQKNKKALCLYDGFLTVVDLSLSSIMSDYTTSNVKRARLSKARSVGNILASFIVFLSYCVWDRDDIESFKVSFWVTHENSRFLAFLLHHCRFIINWFLFWKLLPAGQPALSRWNEFPTNRWKVKFVQCCLQIHGSTVPNA